MKRWLWMILVIVLLAAGGGVWWWQHNQSTQTVYRTVTVERGDVVQVVRATGTVAPIKLVQVGTQVNGPITKLNVDFNDQVKENEIVAQIDPTVYKARLAQDEANLLQSQAGLEQAKAKLIQAEKDLAREQELTRRDLASQSDLDSAVANRDVLAAQVRLAEAQVSQSRAAEEVSRANLDYTTIRSPVNGVVISRNVSEGQTVVASLSAQTIFEIATDLSQVQVEASIPEADIGQIRPQQPVTFTVDAYDEDFHGRVSQIRMSAATVQNVVTYPVIILADNPNGKLFPGMTANITCEIARRTNVLKVANAALRFKPETTNTAVRAASTRPAGAGGKREGHGGAAGSRVWIQPKPGAPLQPVHVRLGINDGSYTELKEPVDLKEGQEVVTGVLEGSAQVGVVNPFTPQFPGRNARRAR